MALRYLDEQPEQMQEQAAPKRIRYLDEPQANNGDIERQVLAEMPWIQRQAVAAGGVLAKAGQGLKGLVGGEIDQDLVRQANIASEEAPVGSFAGEAIKYAPSILAPQTIPAQMAAAGAIGATTDVTNKRLQAGAMDAAFAGIGTKIGRDVLPWMAGKAKEGYSTVRQAMGGAPAERYYGSLDKAREALRTIIGEKNIQYASGALDNAGDVRSAQALANMPDAEGVAALDKIVRSKSGIQAAADPMEAARAYTGQAARQEEARQFAMQKMARGASAEETALARDFFIKQAEAELGPKRVSMLNDLMRPGKKLDEILPMLSNVERRYVEALQNQGRMATEAAQQGVLATGQRAADGQLIRNLPDGNFPRDPSIVQPAGLPAGAYPVSGQPRVPPRYAPNVGPEAQFAGAADELGNVASGLRSEADILRQQISELPSAFTAAPVRDAVSGMAATTVNPAKRSVLEAVAKELALAGDDPVKIADIRKLGVNQLIGDLVESGKVPKTDAASALIEVKKVIDKQLGSDFVTNYLEPYAKKLAARDSLAAADELRFLQENNPKKFMKIIKGEDTDFVQKYSNTAKTIQELLGQKRMKVAGSVAGEMARDRALKDMTKGDAGMSAKAAVGSVLNEGIYSRYIPNILNRYVTVANEAIASGKMKVQRGMYRELEKAMRDPQRMKELIDMLPPEQRSKMIGYVAELGKGGGVAGASYAAEQRQ